MWKFSLFQMEKSGRAASSGSSSKTSHDSVKSPSFWSWWFFPRALVATLPILVGLVILLSPVLVHFIICGTWCVGLSVSLLWSMGCLVSGMGMGFLFALPKVLQKNTDREYNLIFNTNLEQISDWLCKIIVGMGLIELQNLPAKLASMSQVLASALGGEKYQAFAGGLIVYFAVAGFLLGYLTTRLYLTKAIADADRGALRDDLQDVVEKEIRLKNEEFRRNRLEMALLMGKTAQLGVATDSYVKDARLKLEETLEDFPGNRKLAMILAWLYSEQNPGKNLDRAIKILSDALRKLESQRNADPNDIADMNFNLAGYYQRKHDRAAKENRESLATLLDDHLRAALKRPENIAEINRDPDLTKIKDISPFKETIAQAKAAIPPSTPPDPAM